MNQETQPDLSRRNFGKLAATLGAAATMPAFGTADIEASQKAATDLRKKYVLKNTDSPIVIDPKNFKRFKQTNVTFMHPDTAFVTNEEGKKLYYMQAVNENAYKNLLSSKYSKDVNASSVEAARSAVALKIGSWGLALNAGYGDENRALLKWNPMSPMYWNSFYNRQPDVTDPDTLTLQTKFAARLAGADLVGIAPLNKNWVYTNTRISKDEDSKEQVEKKIVFKDVDEPIETQTELIIPSSVNNVIVSAIAQSREILQTSPSTMADAASGTGYSRMSAHDIALCEFIRGMGYIAIPTCNGVGQSVPMAVEAGLGQASRMGTLITPEYGPNVRLTKILTNMPLNHDKPIDFGVQTFCQTCKKCARECPSKCITEDNMSFKPRNIHNQGGKLQFQNDYRKCISYWVESGTFCSICVAVCPFTKGAMWGHKGVEWLIDNMRFLDPVMLGFDDALKYGERRDIEEVWHGKMNTYGLDADHLKNTEMKGV